MSRTTYNDSTPSRYTFTRSTTNDIKTFAEINTSRDERLNQISDDLRAQKERRIQELQAQLQELTIEVNATQAELAQEERNFLAQEEALVTQLNRIKIEAEIKAEECRNDHMEKLEMLLNKHLTARRELTEKIQETIGGDEDGFKRSMKLDAAKTHLKNMESSLRELKSSQVDEQDPNDVHDQEMYAEKIRELEMQRKQVINEFKQNQASHKSQIMELTLALDEQDTSYQKEIADIQAKMQRKEVEYQEQLEKCFKQLSSIQERRDNLIAQRRQKVVKLQAEIKDIQNEFHRKMRDVTRVAEKLKTALVNVNLRKSQQLQVEKDASNEQQALLKENYALQQQLYQMQKQLSNYKDEFSVLRKELSSTIGPRRTASLFI